MTPAWNHEPTVTTVAEGRGTAWNHKPTITTVAEGRGTYLMPSGSDESRHPSTSRPGESMFCRASVELMVVRLGSSVDNP
jgi:hypothetical protein